MSVRHSAVPYQSFAHREPSTVVAGCVRRPMTPIPGRSFFKNDQAAEGGARTIPPPTRGAPPRGAVFYRPRRPAPARSACGSARVSRLAPARCSVRRHARVVASSLELSSLRQLPARLAPRRAFLPGRGAAKRDCRLYMVPPVPAGETRDGGERAPRGGPASVGVPFARVTRRKLR